MNRNKPVAADWQLFNLPELVAAQDSVNVSYQEFLRSDAMSCGLYHLPAGSKDMQGSHDDDEVYYVLQGRGRLRVGSEDRAVEPGDLMYVRAAAEHHFLEIEEDMTLLVFFANGAG